LLDATSTLHSSYVSPLPIRMHFNWTLNSHTFTFADIIPRLPLLSPISPPHSHPQSRTEISPSTPSASSRLPSRTMDFEPCFNSPSKSVLSPPYPSFSRNASSLSPSPCLQMIRRVGWFHRAHCLLDTFAWREVSPVSPGSLIIEPVLILVLTGYKPMIYSSIMLVTARICATTRLTGRYPRCISSALGGAALAPVNLSIYS
jgi:hypothetical protein